MSSGLLIQEAAKLMGISPDTLRYYERAGFLPVVQRDSSGHRRYSELDLSWIDFLLQCRAAGMNMTQLQTFVAMHQQPQTSAAQVQAFFMAHLQELEARIAQLEQHRDKVQQKIGYYQKLTGSIPRPSDPAKQAKQRQKIKKPS